MWKSTLGTKKVTSKVDKLILLNGVVYNLRNWNINKTTVSITHRSNFLLPSLTKSLPKSDGGILPNNDIEQADRWQEAAMSNRIGRCIPSHSYHDIYFPAFQSLQTHRAWALWTNILCIACFSLPTKYWNENSISIVWNNRLIIVFTQLFVYFLQFSATVNPNLNTRWTALNQVLNCTDTSLKLHTHKWLYQLNWKKFKPITDYYRHCSP